MIDWILGVTEWWTSGWLGLFLFWMPAVLCSVGYSYTTVQDFRRDVDNRNRYERVKQTGAYAHYDPDLTFGVIVWRVCISWTPVGNLLALIFDVLSEYAAFITKVLSIPLVPKRGE